MTDRKLEEALHVRGLIDKAILEKGEDYVYPHTRPSEDGLGCWYLEYADADQEVPIGPSCLVGHVLAYDGVPYEVMVAHEGCGACDLAPYSMEVREALRAAQLAQDARESWGSAREAYDQMIMIKIRDYNPGRDA